MGNNQSQFIGLQNEYLSLEFCNGMIDSMRIDPYGNGNYTESLLSKIYLQGPRIHDIPTLINLPPNYISQEDSISWENVQIRSPLLVLEGKLTYKINKNHLDCIFTSSCRCRFRGWDMGFEALLPAGKNSYLCDKPFSLLLSDRRISLPIASPHMYRHSKSGGLIYAPPAKEWAIYLDEWVYGFGTEGYDAKFSSFGYALRWNIGSQMSILKFYPERVLCARSGQGNITRSLSMDFLPPLPTEKRLQLLQSEKDEIVVPIRDALTTQYKESDQLEYWNKEWEIQSLKTCLGKTLMAGINEEIPEKELLVKGVPEGKYSIKAGLMSPRSREDPYIYSYKINKDWKSLPVWAEITDNIITEHTLSNSQICDSQRR